MHSRSGEAEPRSGASAAPDRAPADGAARPPADGVAATIPQRPQLAPGVRLRGRMEETGFDASPWLVERDGAFIQLTELLYRVAEQADGRQSLAEIARSVAVTCDRAVSAANVAQLAAKLIPLGIILAPDGSVQTAADQAERSPLAMTAKLAMLPPGAIAPVTRPLTVLYWPPLLVVALIAVAVAQGWLFLVEGVGAGVRDVLYEPALLLGVCGVLVAGAAFHELGHAAALQYGGGRVRGMGAGFYLIYPAFYTDVSENYLLPRWARVRTDLGGFYFSLLVALAMIGLHLGTGWQFPLIVVLLINLDILRQLMPFVRLDGYWTLVDLTGMPDFYSSMGAFVRGQLPGGRRRGKAPQLKPWVRVVFALYMLITTPVLVILLFGALRGLPRVLATAWDSARLLFGEIGQARAAGELVAMLAAAVQLLILALPAAGLLLLVITLIRSSRRHIRAWRAGSLARRVASALGIALVLTLLALLWLPSLPRVGGGNRPNPLYSQSTFRPIGAGERGTLGDAVRAVPAVGQPVVERFSLPVTAPSPPLTPVSTSPAGTATPAAGAAPLATATPEPDATPTPDATGTPDPTPPPTATPTVTASVTPTPTAPATATPTATPSASPATPALGGGAPAGTATATPPRPATATATPSPTPAAATGTSTAGATGTRASTPPATPVRTLTPTPLPAGRTVVRATVAAAVRGGPGANFPVLATLPAGSEVIADGRSADGRWVRFATPAGPGWVSIDLLQIVSGSVAALPVIPSGSP